MARPPVKSNAVHDRRYRALQRIRLWIALVPVIGVLAGIAFLLVFDLFAGFALIVGVSTGTVLWLHLSRRWRSTLAALGFRVCPRCLYSLHHLGDEGRCPECGYRATPVSLRRDWSIRLTRLGGRTPLPELWTTLARAFPFDAEPHGIRLHVIVYWYRHRASLLMAWIAPRGLIVIGTRSTGTKNVFIPWSAFEVARHSTRFGERLYLCLTTVPELEFRLASSYNARVAAAVSEGTWDGPPID